MRIVVELRRNEVPEVVLNNLFAQTQLQTVFGINTVALVDGQPKILNLKDMLEAFVRHRREVVTRRTIFELRKARERGHILEGLTVALSNIDPVIAAIKSSPGAAEAKEKLVTTPWQPGDVLEMLERAGSDACRPDHLEPQYGFRDGQYYMSPVQAQAILDMRLQKLTGLEHEKLIDEYKVKVAEIAEYLEILASQERLMGVIREELENVRSEYGDERRTEIVATRRHLTLEDLIAEEDMVVTLSHGGYAKIQPITDYQAQKRGGRGKSASAIKDEDFIEHLLIASTHDTILCFSNRGKVYWLKVYDIPVASRQSRGRPVVNLLPLDADERITTILPIREYTEGHYIFMATEKGTVKKTDLTAFARQRSSGLIALELDEDDTLMGAAITDGTKDILLMSDGGKAVRFAEENVRKMGRTARGVRGIKLAEGQAVVSLIIPEEGGTLLTASEKGYGKRTDITEFPTKGRGTQGVIGMVVNDRNGKLVGAVQVHDGHEIMLISDQGTLVRTRVSEVSKLGRNTQGVTLIKVQEGERLVGVAPILDADDDLDPNLLVDVEAVSDASVDTDTDVDTNSQEGE
ncbi:MAG: DNA gyrase subunit A [Bermanella sp.]|jgi:DNA gyrase subunit A